MALLDKSQLSEEDLEKVNGGFLYTARDTNGTEVIDDRDGHVIAKFVSHADAVAYAQEHGIDTTDLYWCELERIRKGKQF